MSFVLHISHLALCLLLASTLNNVATQQIAVDAEPGTFPYTFQKCIRKEKLTLFYFF